MKGTHIVAAAATRRCCRSSCRVVVVVVAPSAATVVVSGGHPSTPSFFPLSIFSLSLSSSLTHGREAVGSHFIAQTAPDLVRINPKKERKKENQANNGEEEREEGNTFSLLWRMGTGSLCKCIELFCRTRSNKSFATNNPLLQKTGCRARINNSRPRPQ